MTFYNLLTNRKSVREYTDESISLENLNKIVDAARLAPSARNAQNWKFIIVNEEDSLKKLFESMPQKFTHTCKAAIVVCGLKDGGMMSSEQPRTSVDTSIATTIIQLMATELGIGSCWIGDFDVDIANKALNVPDDMVVATITVLGYQKNEIQPKPRKAFDEVVSYNKF